ncbi:MAG: hypothetical protein ABW250_17400, partial [Pyrinomonadaceae bacterium]
MNPQTVTLIERPYNDIVDDILTAIVGGVVNEQIVFDVKEDLYPLSQPASDVRSITGTRSERAPDGRLLPRARYTFQKLVDYDFSRADNAVVWLPGTARPDDETFFYVDYFIPDSRSPLSDINVGSVTRTLGESVGREIATVYQQIKAAYEAGFIDTAKGPSLDLVVSILGVVRQTAELAVGLVTLFRDAQASDGNITIPEGTPLGNEAGDKFFVTVQTRTLQRGQARIDVPVRARADLPGQLGIVKPGEITKTALPLTGVSRVTNFDATVLGSEDETDEELRSRARAVLRGLGKATHAALANAIFENRATLSEVKDPNGPPGKRTPPGTAVLLVESEPERFLSLRTAVEQTRAAGVMVTLTAYYVFFKPRVVAVVAPGLSAEGKAKVTAEIIAALQSYVDGLGAGDPAVGAEMLKRVTQVKEVGKKTKFVDAMAWQADLGETNDEALVKALVDAVKTARANEGEADEVARDTALQLALRNAVSVAAPPAPTGRRTPARDLVRGLSGARATDEEVEAGQFEVVPPETVGQRWWVVLDVEPADILL